MGILGTWTSRTYALLFSTIPVEWPLDSTGQTHTDGHRLISHTEAQSSFV